MAVIGTFGSFTAARLGIYASQASLNVTGKCFGVLLQMRLRLSVCWKLLMI